MHAIRLKNIVEKSRQARTERWPPERAIVSSRRTSAAALTLFAIALAVVFGIQWGAAGLWCYLPWLPFAFVLLWGSTTALRFDERSSAEGPEVGIAPSPLETLQLARGSAR